jgi:hypothetical protein
VPTKTSLLSGPKNVITFVLDSPIPGPGHPEWKKSEGIFPAIQIFVPERLGSAAYLTPWEVHLDSWEVTFPAPTTAATPLAPPLVP